MINECFKQQIIDRIEDMDCTTIEQLKMPNNQNSPILG